MLSGEIRVMELVEESKRRNIWKARQRRMIEHWALKAWDKASHPPDGESEAVTQANKRAVIRLYGKSLELALLKRKLGWEILQAYREALERARTPTERRRAAEMLEMGVG